MLDAISPSSIKNLDYFSNERGAKASRLDQAWANYKNKDLPMNERLKALDFMIYVFDVKKFSGDKEYLNKLLDTLMAQRERVKETKPDYIPVLAKGKYKLETNGREVPVTIQSKSSSDEEIQRAFDDGELLDVNWIDKFNDPRTGFVTYLTPEQREEYRIEIYDGKFHKEGQIFDSSKSEAHDKVGYVAFTLNTDGELSVFKHLSVTLDEDGRRLAHSSMNAGAPVLAAGEMEIKNGKLISINTFSGHYQPSLYSVARFLEYLSERGVDISETKVYLHNSPDESTGLKANGVMIGNQPWFEISATDIVHSVKAIMTSSINLLDDYLKSSKTKLLGDASRAGLTAAQSEIAQNFHDELVLVMDALKDSTSRADIETSLQFLDSMIDRYSRELEKLSGNKEQLTSKFADMKSQISTTREALKASKKVDEAEQIQSFKSQY